MKSYWLSRLEKICLQIFVIFTWIYPPRQHLFQQETIPREEKSLSLHFFNKSNSPTVRTRHGKTDWIQIGKGVHQGCILSPCLFNFCAEYIMRHKLESRLLGEISITSDRQMTPPLWQKVKRN